MVFYLIASLGLSLLLMLEQYRSLRPSDLATTYLIITILCDAIVLTMPQEQRDTLHLMAVRCFINLLILILECNKRPSTESTETASPEERSGFLGMIFFTWINPILFQGYKSILTIQDLPPLSQDMKPELTRRSILRIWGQRG